MTLACKHPLVRFVCFWVLVCLCFLLVLYVKAQSQKPFFEGIHIIRNLWVCLFRQPFLIVRLPFPPDVWKIMGTVLNDPFFRWNGIMQNIPYNLCAAIRFLSVGPIHYYNVDWTDRRESPQFSSFNLWLICLIILFAKIRMSHSDYLNEWKETFAINIKGKGEKSRSNRERDGM